MTWTWPRIERRTVLVMLGAYSVFGLWQGNTVWLAMQADGAHAPWLHPYFWEVTGTLSSLAWAWIPFAAAKNAPRPGGRWARFLGIHAAGYALYAALHTALMLGTRVLLYPVIGWGSYHYGGTAFRLPMEWHKDLLAYVLLAVGYGLVTSWQAAQRRALRDAQLATELRDAQLRALVGQLNPHFLFNALNTISAVMYTDLARTDRLLADLGDMLRAGLTGNAAPTWSLAEERAHTEHFLAMMLARFGDRLSIRWKVDVAASTAQVPRFTLQLLVENAIKHNEDARGPLEIAITVRRVGARVEVEVTDNGRGFDAAGFAAPGQGPRAGSGSHSSDGGLAGSVIDSGGGGATASNIGSGPGSGTGAGAGSGIAAGAGSGGGLGTGRGADSWVGSAAGLGTGLATLRRALELCHGPNTTLVLDRAPGGGACVRLTLPAELAA